MPGPTKGKKKKNAQGLVLTCLAENGLLNIYQIQKKTCLNYSSAFKAVKTLLMENSVQEAKKVESLKKMLITLYGLTFKGFQIYLSSYQTTYRNSTSFYMDRRDKIS